MELIKSISESVKKNRCVEANVSWIWTECSNCGKIFNNIPEEAKFIVYYNCGQNYEIVNGENIKISKFECQK